MYKQAAHVDLKFYEDPKYYNDLNLAVTEGISRIEQVLDSLSYLLSSLAALFYQCAHLHDKSGGYAFLLYTDHRYAA